ncbi:MAG: transaldolase family protein, partial [Terriglobales bacterium]
MGNASPFGSLNVRVFADVGDPTELQHYLSMSWIAGATTNPSLMAKHGHFDAISFAKEVAPSLEGRSLSIVPMAANADEFLEQSLLLSSIDANIFIKVPIIDNSQDINQRIASSLINSVVGVHITCVHTLEQAAIATEILRGAGRGFISVFAGRVSDSGESPLQLVSGAAALTREVDGVELVLACTREPLN